MKPDVTIASVFTHVSRRVLSAVVSRLCQVPSTQPQKGLLLGSNHYRHFNPLEQFFNTVYTRDFLVQILFTQTRITWEETICLWSLQTGSLRGLSIFQTYQEEINQRSLCCRMHNQSHGCDAADRVVVGWQGHSTHRGALLEQNQGRYVLTKIIWWLTASRNSPGHSACVRCVLTWASL